MLIALCGVLFILIQPLLKNGLSNPTSLGNLFFLLATICACGQSLFGKKVYSNHNFVLITFLSFVIGSLIFLPLAFLEFKNNPGWISNLDIRGISGIIYGSIFSSAMAYSFLGYGLSKIPASETTIYGYIDPINATLIAVTLLGEKITSSHLIGAFFVLSGIFLAEKRIHYHPILKLKT